MSVVVYLPQVVVSAEKVIWQEFSKPLPPPRRIMANFIPSGQLAPLGQTVQSISPGLSVSLLTQLTPWLQWRCLPGQRDGQIARQNEKASRFYSSL